MRQHIILAKAKMIAMAKATAMTIMLTLVTVGTYAQQFKVRSFKQLPNDISAYINPVRDLNQEACALIKVVGDKAFAFSSPLGIVHRLNQTGEIWIYLPRGSKMITIKHPQWGIIRDFLFNAPLESRMTYELVLSPPEQKEYNPNAALHNNPTFPYIGYNNTSDTNTKLPLFKIKQPLVWSILYFSGFYSKTYSGGVMISLRRRHGIYLHLQSDYHSATKTNGECEKDGAVGDGKVYPYYTGEKKSSMLMVFVGGIHHMTEHFDIYEGVGYGNRTMAWQISDGSYLRNKGYSYKGVAAELGVVYEFNTSFLLSGGIMSIMGKYWEPSIGIGYHF